MNDSEFLELLNLYLDHEISAADAVRLEAEVQANAERRAVYREYCRMQKACKLLVDDFQTARAETEEGAGGGKLVRFGTHAAARSRGAGIYVASAVAVAAACVALVFLGRGGMPSHDVLPGGRDQSMAKQAPRASETPSDGLALGAANRAPRSLAPATGLQRANGSKNGTLVSDSLVLSGRKQAEVIFAAAEQEADDQLAWMRSFQLVSLQERKLIDQLHFEAAPVTLRPEGRQLGGQTPATATAEMTAFRFVK